MPAIRLVLLAHAETAATRRAAFATGEEPLVAKGRRAADSSRGVLGHVDAILASPAVAARETADALGLEARPEPALRDLDPGRWAGRPVTEIAPDDLAAWASDPHFAGHGGESLAALRDRVERVLAAGHRQGTTLAITHAAVLRAALTTALGAPVPAFWRIDAPPLCALTLGSDGRRWTLRGFGPLASMRSASAR